MQNSQPQVFAFPTPTISPPLSPLKRAISGDTPIIIDNGFESFLHLQVYYCIPTTKFRKKGSHNYRAGFGDAELPYSKT